jgi:hypothetical protein
MVGLVKGRNGSTSLGGAAVAWEGMAGAFCGVPGNPQGWLLKR